MAHLLGGEIYIGDPDMKRCIYDASDKSRSLEEIREIMKRNEVVFAVWEDFDNPDGLVVMVVKGEVPLASALDQGGVNCDARASFLCNDYEEANEFRRQYGRVVTMDFEGDDCFIKLDGVPIAKREDRKWTPLEPGFEVLGGGPDDDHVDIKFPSSKDLAPQ
jgi:hypothetical protein